MVLSRRKKKNNTTAAAPTATQTVAPLFPISTLPGEYPDRHRNKYGVRTAENSRPVEARQHRGGRRCLATVVAIEGSAYRRPALACSSHQRASAPEHQRRLPRSRSRQKSLVAYRPGTFPPALTPVSSMTMATCPTASAAAGTVLVLLERGEPAAQALEALRRSVEDRTASVIVTSTATDSPGTALILDAAEKALYARRPDPDLAALAAKRSKPASPRTSPSTSSKSSPRPPPCSLRRRRPTPAARRILPGPSAGTSPSADKPLQPRSPGTLPPRRPHRKPRTPPSPHIQPRRRPPSSWTDSYEQDREPARPAFRGISNISASSDRAAAPTASSRNRPRTRPLRRRMQGPPAHTRRTRLGVTRRLQIASPLLRKLQAVFAGHATPASFHRRPHSADFPLCRGSSWPPALPHASVTQKLFDRRRIAAPTEPPRLALEAGLLHRSRCSWIRRRLDARRLQGLAADSLLIANGRRNGRLAALRE